MKIAILTLDLFNLASTVCKYNDDEDVTSIEESDHADVYNEKEEDEEVKGK